MCPDAADDHGHAQQGGKMSFLPADVDYINFDPSVRCQTIDQRLPVRLIAINDGIARSNPAGFYLVGIQPAAAEQPIAYSFGTPF